MTRPVTRLKTRRPSRAAEPAPAGPVLPTLYSNETGRSYRLDRLIGKGGFGEIYLATPSSAGAIPPRVCVQPSYRIAGWLRGAYFAELLARQARALRVFARLVQVESPATGNCPVLETAAHADLRAGLPAHGAPPESS